MITYNKDYGCWFQMTEDSKHYALYEAMTYKHSTTSDRVIIWDNDNDKMVNFVYGANCISIDELDKMVYDYVAEYEAKQKPNQVTETAISYKLTNAGIKAFEDYASTDFFAEMDKDWEEQNLDEFDIVVSCGRHEIRIPIGAEEWDSLNGFLRFCVEVNE